MWISTPVCFFERKPLPFFITLPLLALPSRSLLRTGLYATRYPSSVCRLEVLFRYALPVCPPRKRWRGVAFITYLYMLHHTFSVSRYLTLFYNVLPRCNLGTLPLRRGNFVRCCFRKSAGYAYKETPRSRCLCSSPVAFGNFYAGVHI